VKWLIPAALLLGSAPDDPAATALYGAIRDRIRSAPSLRAEIAVTLVSDGQDIGSLRAFLKIRPPDRWICDLSLVRRDLGEEERRGIVLQCDGRRARVVEGALPRKDLPLDPRALFESLRRSSVDSFFPLIELVDVRLLHRGVLEKPLEVGSFRGAGTEKVGGRDADLLEYSFRAPHLAAQPQQQDGTIKVWVDRETKLPLQRKLTLNGFVWQETLALDFGDVPDAQFSFQSRPRLARAELGQLAESVRLFERFTGRPPDTLEDLARKPADLDAELFWPRGGFLLGGLPRDPWGHPFEFQVHNGRCTLICRGADGVAGGAGEDEDLLETIAPATGSGIGAPTERLAAHFEARVDGLLRLAAVKAYQDAYAELPREEKQLREREAWMQVWPEGGWLPGDPKDPRFGMLFTERQIRILARDPTTALEGSVLTEAEQRRLDEIARPRVRPSERPAIAALLGQLGDDDFDVRVLAQAELRNWGPRILSMLEDRQKGETDAEVLYRLQALRKALPKHEPAWPSELGPLRFLILSEDVQPEDVRANEDLAASALKILASAEAAFRSNDRDGNGINDFWTGDVAGLYQLTTKGERFSIKMIGITLASADAAPLPRESGATPAPPLPRHGYWYRVLRKDRSTQPPEDYATDTTGRGGPRTYNRNRFGFVAYPAEYGVSGLRTLIINEATSVYGRDTQGEPVEDWPDDATRKREWTLLK
jgi:general secretion pathway protein G